MSFITVSGSYALNMSDPQLTLPRATQAKKPWRHGLGYGQV